MFESTVGLNANQRPSCYKEDKLSARTENNLGDEHEKCLLPCVSPVQEKQRPVKRLEAIN